MATVMCFLPFQIQQHYLNNEEVQTQQEIEMDFKKRMASLINEVMAVFYITFWRGAANPQSGEIIDCSDEIYDLTPDLHY